MLYCLTTCHQLGKKAKKKWDYFSDLGRDNIYLKEKAELLIGVGGMLLS